MRHGVPAAAGLKYAAADEATKTSLKVIADHTRAVVYLLSDGVIPSNVSRGYVARRLLRRVVLKGRLLGIRKPFVGSVAEAVVSLSQGCDPAVEGNKSRLLEEISREEGRFTATISAGALPVVPVQIEILRIFRTVFWVSLREIITRLQEALCAAHPSPIHAGGMPVLCTYTSSIGCCEPNIPQLYTHCSP